MATTRVKLTKTPTRICEVSGRYTVENTGLEVAFLNEQDSVPSDPSTITFGHRLAPRGEPRTVTSSGDAILYAWCPVTAGTDLAITEAP